MHYVVIQTLTQVYKVQASYPSASLERATLTIVCPSSLLCAHVWHTCMCERTWLHRLSKGKPAPRCSPSWVGGALPLAQQPHPFSSVAPSESFAQPTWGMWATVCFHPRTHAPVLAVALSHLLCPPGLPVLWIAPSLQRLDVPGPPLWC